MYCLCRYVLFRLSLQGMIASVPTCISIICAFLDRNEETHIINNEINKYILTVYNILLGYLLGHINFKINMTPYFEKYQQFEN